MSSNRRLPSELPVVGLLLLLALGWDAVNGFVVHIPSRPEGLFVSTTVGSLRSSSELHGIRSTLRRIFQREDSKEESSEPEPTEDPIGKDAVEKPVEDSTETSEKIAENTAASLDVDATATPDTEATSEGEDDGDSNSIGKPIQQSWIPSILTPKEKVSVCVVGGGVSGLTAAAACAKGLAKNSEANVVLLESSDDVGGRVRSDKTEDGFTLDRGFAVFITEYPQAKTLLDFKALKLGEFLPGALVKIRKNRSTLARVADPLRQPGEIFEALTAPVGDIFDKVGILGVVMHVRGKSVDELFEEQETSTQDALTKRWMFSDEILERFFKPFLEGIYLAPIKEQSSRMFSFVFKMFSEGAATLPEGGIGAVAKQLGEKAEEAGVDIRLNAKVKKILEEEESGYTIITESGNRITADALVIATDGEVANGLVAQIKGFESLESLPSQAQREVGNLYYSFNGECPVSEPILILNGIGKERGNEENPVNNVCFPSVVAKGYAPEGHNLCSVTVLKEAMDLFEGKDEELDTAVRKQLGTWFPNHREAIKNTWDLKRIYRIKNAQPGQFEGPFPANVNRGRATNTYRNKELPPGLFVCGDHMSTATLNGALESGSLAGAAAFKAVPKPKT